MLTAFGNFLLGIIALVSAALVSYWYVSSPSNIPPIEQTPSAITTTAPSQKTPAVATTTSKTVAKTPAKTTTAVPKAANGSLTAKTATVVPQTVAAPGPLVAKPTTTTTKSTDLTVRGVIEYTNGARSSAAGLPALIENATLDQDAQIKLSDMFTKQYFEHVSPSGVGPSDIAKTVGYDFILVGENLALGDFGSDQGVVTAWMNSPGHRANILNTHYQEIGVAVGKGMYEGRETWLAVQSFGMPRSACPAIDSQKQAQITFNNAQLKDMRATLDAKQQQINATSQSDPMYMTYVNEYNAMIPDYNTLVETTRALVNDYNAQVQFFNTCVNAAGTASTTH